MAIGPVAMPWCPTHLQTSCAHVSPLSHLSHVRALGGPERCAGAHCRQTLAEGELGLSGNEADQPSPEGDRPAIESHGRATLQQETPNSFT